MKILLKISGFICLSIFIMLFISTKYVEAIVSPTSEFYVNDYADILSEESVAYIIEKSEQLNEIDGTQIVVVTIPSLEGAVLEEYSLELARSFGIGDEDKNNGLLLLLTLEERMFRVEVGYGLEEILPDGKTGRFQDDYIIPYLKDNKWDEGIINGYNAFYDEIVTLNNLDVEYDKPLDQSVSTIPDEMSSREIVGLIISLVSSILFGALIGYQASIPDKLFYAKSSWYKNNKGVQKLVEKYKTDSNYPKVKINKKKIIIFIIAFVICSFISVLFAGALTVVVSVIFFVIGYFSQAADDGTRSDSDYGSSSGSSFGGGGSSGGGGSFGGGGSSRGF